MANQLSVERSANNRDSTRPAIEKVTAGLDDTHPIWNCERVAEIVCDAVDGASSGRVKLGTSNGRESPVPS